MTKPKRVFKKLIGITERHQEMVTHLLEDRGFTSESDVIRYAISLAHDKLYPAYVFHLSPAAQIKKRKVKESVVFDETSDEDFAKSIGALIEFNNEEKQFVLLHQIGNCVMAIPVEGFKKWCEGHQLDVDFHKERINKKTIESMMSVYQRSILAADYGLNLEKYAADPVSEPVQQEQISDIILG